LIKNHLNLKQAMQAIQIIIENLLKAAEPIIFKERILKSSS